MSRFRTIWFWIVAAVSAALIFGILVTGVRAAEQDPMTSTRQMVDDALGILRNNQISIAEKRRELRSAVEPKFDFADMAHSSLSSRWDSLSPEQRESFVTLFTAFIEDAYLNKIQDYSGQEIRFTGQSADKEGYATIRSSVVGGGEEPIGLDFRLRLNGGNWMIYDVLIDGISMTANYRSQFTHVIDRDGFSALMDMMEKKRANLEAMLGRR